MPRKLRVTPSALALEHGATSQKNLAILSEEETEGAVQRELSCLCSLSLAARSPLNRETGNTDIIPDATLCS